MFAYFLFSHGKAQNGSAQAAHDVGQVVHIVLDGDGIQPFAAQIEHRHQDQRQRDGSPPHPGQGGQEDAHKHDAAGPQQGCARKQEKLTQSQLAQKVGTDKTYISRIEKGLIEPGISMFCRIIDALGLKIEIVKVM